MKIGKMKRETLRHMMSAVLMDTSEEHPLECDVCLDAEACGLSTLSMTHVDRCFQDGEGIIWFHIQGDDDSHYMEFDDMNVNDLRTIYDAMV